MVLTLDEDLTHEEQKLFGELYDERGRKLHWCKWCGVWPIYIERDTEGNITLMNMEDNTVHFCHNLAAVRGYYQKESF